MLTRQRSTEQWFAGEFDQSVVTFGQIKAWFLCFFFFFEVCDIWSIYYHIVSIKAQRQIA